MNKKLLILMMLIMIVLVGCSSSNESSAANSDGNSSASNTIQIKTVNATVQDASIINQGLDKFKEIVEEKSEGKLEVENFRGGAMASTDEMALEQMQSGAMEVSSAPLYIMGKNANMGAFNFMNMPYLFNNYDEVYEFLDSPYMEELTKEYEEKTNSKVLSYYGTGGVSIANAKRPVHEPNDLEGIKLRSFADDLAVQTLESMGAIPAPIPYGEVFTATQQGIIDGLVTVTPLIYDDLFYQVTDYVTITDYMFFIHVVQINKEFYEGLPGDMREIIDEAAKEHNTYTKELTRQAEIDTIEKFKDAGLEVIELTDEQKDKFKDATQPVIDKNIELIGQETYDKILEIVNKD